MKVVGFDNDILGKNYVRQTGLPFPLLLDRERRLYRAYGMERGTWWQIYGPGTIAKYIALMMRGRMPGKPGEDWRQLGGDVLISPEGIIRMHHVSRNPHDRPSVAAILRIVDGEHHENDPSDVK